MYVIGIIGWKNAGKTTLLTALLPHLTAEGATVSTIKHTHHSVDLDQPGKDTYRHRAAGAHEVMLVSSARWALMREARDDDLPTLDRVLARMAPADVVLVEGWKIWPHDKIELHRQAIGGELMARGDDTIKAVVSDEPFVGLMVPVFGLDDAERIARFILDRAGRQRY